MKIIEKVNELILKQEESLVWREKDDSAENDSSSQSSSSSDSDFDKEEVYGSMFNTATIKRTDVHIDNFINHISSGKKRKAPNPDSQSKSKKQNNNTIYRNNLRPSKISSVVQYSSNLETKRPNNNLKLPVQQRLGPLSTRVVTRVSSAVRGGHGHGVAGGHRHPTLGDHQHPPTWGQKTSYCSLCNRDWDLCDCETKNFEVH